MGSEFGSSMILFSGVLIIILSGAMYFWLQVNTALRRADPELRKMTDTTMLAGIAIAAGGWISIDANMSPMAQLTAWTVFAVSLVACVLSIATLIKTMRQKTLTGYQNC